MSCRSLAVATAVLLACVALGRAGSLFADLDRNRELEPAPHARPPPASEPEDELDDEDETGDADERPRPRPRITYDERFRLERPPALGTSREAIASPGYSSYPPLRRLYATTVGVLTAPAGWGRTEWLTFTAMAGIPAVFIATGADEDFTKLFSRDLTEDKAKVKDFGEELGTPPLALGILSSFGIYGALADDDRGVQVFETGLLSGAISAGVVQVLKRGTGRARPNAGEGARVFAPFSGAASFPSGHTALAYAVAVSVNDQYPGWIGRGMYVLATTTAFARVYQLNHWTSDVIVGATIGGATAHLVTKLNRAAREGDLRLVPRVDHDGGGLELRGRF